MNKPHATYRSYITGFVLSLILTLASYSIVLQHVNSHHSTFSHTFIVFWIVAFALTQLVVQLVCFLHLGRESKPRWNLAAFSFMILVVVIVVFGSIWIMNNLNYNMVHGGKDVDTYMMQDEGILH